MSEIRLKILLVEDDEDDYIFVRDLLSEVSSTHYDLDWVDTFESALKAVERGGHDVYLLDYRLGEHDGLELLHAMRSRMCNAPIIFLTGQGSFDVDVEAMRSGAADYLIKSQINAPLLERSIRYAVERRKSEEDLRKSEEMMRLIINSSPIGIRICRRSRHAYANPAFLSMFGYESLEEIMGLSEEMLISPEQRDEARRRKQDRFVGGRVPLSYEAKGIKKNGERFDLSVRQTRIEYRGEPAILDFLIDVSIEKTLQARLLSAQKMQAIGTLAGGIAHDFNNILGIILGLTELALCDAPEGGRQRVNLEHVLEATQRGIDLVSQIMTFSRQNEQLRKPLHIIPITKEILKLMRASLPSTVEIRQKIDLSQEEDVILSDPTQIHQILLNLCMNSAHAMREKGGCLEIGLSSVCLEPADAGRPPDLEPGRYVRLSVSDTGHGVDASIIDRIFEPYFTTKEFGEGTGLGLGVVHGIVKSHGGTVTVYSEPGKGTTFHVYLPECDGDVKIGTEAPLTMPTGSERVLIVDDEARLVDAGAQILERLGYRVVSKTSSLDAFDAFCAEPDQFDLIITDQTMPHMTGIELAYKVLSIRPRMPIILCTGFSEIATAERVKEMGIREYVVKPFVMRDMAQKVRRAIDENKKAGVNSHDEDTGA